MIDIFRHDPRGSLWLETAQDFEEAKSKVKTLYAERPAEYFAFDLTKQIKVLFTLEELGH